MGQTEPMALSSPRWNRLPRVYTTEATLGCCWGGSLVDVQKREEDGEMLGIFRA